MSTLFYNKSTDDMVVGNQNSRSEDRHELKQIVDKIYGKKTNAWWSPTNGLLTIEDVYSGDIVVQIPLGSWLIYDSAYTQFKVLTNDELNADYFTREVSK